MREELSPKSFAAGLALVVATLVVHYCALAGAYSFSTYSSSLQAGKTPESSTSGVDTSAYVKELIRLATYCNRGQVKDGGYRPKAEELVKRLEDNFAGTSVNPSQLQGSWQLCFATDDITRSSPFFWGFRKALSGRKDPSPIKLSTSGELAESILAVTDTIPAPIKVLGPAFQDIDFFDDGGYCGEMVSRVEVRTAMSPFPSLMTTTSTIAKVDSFETLFDLRIQTTEVNSENPLVGFIRGTLSPKLSEAGDSIGSELPGILGQSLDRFPSGDVLERVQPGASSVRMRVTYLDDQLRIVRPANGLSIEDDIVFVYTRT